MRIKVIGVGSPHGDDAVGLAVARALAAEPLPGGARAVACDRPGLDLADLLADADAAVVVDALRSGAPLGSVSELAWETLRRGAPASSHGLGAAEGLALAAALGRLPARLHVVGIEVDATARSDGLSERARAALPAAVTRVRALLAELAAGAR